MKRLKSACILQTVVFAQKPEQGYSCEEALKLNREEYSRYRKALDDAKTRYVIVDETESANGSVVIHIKKQYNETVDVSEYF